MIQIMYSYGRIKQVHCNELLINNKGYGEKYKHASSAIWTQDLQVSVYLNLPHTLSHSATLAE